MVVVVTRRVPMTRGAALRSRVKGNFQARFWNSGGRGDSPTDCSKLSDTIYDGRYEIPTFTELLDLRKRLFLELGRAIGVYPETKHPTYFQKAGLPLEQRLVDILIRYGLNRSSAPV